MLDAITAIPAVSALGWAVLHFLWQGCVIAGLAALALSGLREASAQARYIIGCVALACALATFGVTFAVALSLADEPDPALLALLPIAGPAAYASGVDVVVPAVAWLWSVGALLMTARFAIQWRAVRRVKRFAMEDVGERVQYLFQRVCHELGVHQAVRFLKSHLAETPMVIGWLSPVVVVPVSALSSLTRDQLRAVLAHELAHVRRYDYLVNGIQSIIEIVLFFHPAVWWLSGQVRNEREQCCDDVAVHASGNAMVFAKALSRLEALRDDNTQIALAANGGFLMQRIERILGVNTHTRPVASGWQIATGLTVAMALAVVGVVHAAGLQEEEQPLDPKVQQLQEAVAAGEMTLEQARDVYYQDVYPGSEIEAKTLAKFADHTAKIEAMLAAGKITEKEAQAKLDSIHSEQMLNQEMAFGMQVRGLSGANAYLAAVAAKLDEAVANGEVTPEDADKKLAKLEQKLRLTEEHENHMNEVIAKLEAKLAAGEITEEEAEFELASIKRRASAKAEADAKIEQMSAELKAKVAAGDISGKDAKAKLKQFKHDVWAKTKARMHYEDVEAKLDAKIARGEITEDEAKAKLVALKQKLSENDK